MKTVIEMAYEAGAVKAEHTVLNHKWFELTQEQLERFAALVREDEREACAKVCEEMDEGIDGECIRPIYCADAIRARGNNEAAST